MLYRPTIPLSALIYSALDQDLIDAWGLTAVPLGSLDMNRIGVPIDLNNSAFTGKQIKPLVTGGIKWNTDDNGNSWLPQGASSSGDMNPLTGLVDGKRLLFQSWHNSDSKIRLGVADISNLPTSMVYRNILMVEPKTGPYGATFDNIAIHAGGIVAYAPSNGSRLLYCMDTVNGIRVFDLNQILQIPEPNDDTKIGKQSDGSYHAMNYLYILPQVAKYEMAPGFQHRWSFCSLERLDGVHYLVTGEWSTTAEAKLFWWEINQATGWLVADPIDPLDDVVATDLSLNGVHSYHDGSNVDRCLLSTHVGSKLLKRGIDNTVGDTSWTTPGLPQNMTFFEDTGELWITHENPRVFYKVLRSSL